jgi:hypothetical protein
MTERRSINALIAAVLDGALLTLALSAAGPVASASADNWNRVVPDMINIDQRPPEAENRRVPGHSEGDLLIGKANRTAIGTLVERCSGFAMLVAHPTATSPSTSRPRSPARSRRCPRRCAAR